MSLRRRVHAPALLCALAAIAVLAAAGCGGDDTSPKDRYISSADGICNEARQVSTAMQQQIQQVMAQGNVAGAAQVINQYQPEYRRHLDRLAALAPPKGDEARVKAVVAAMNESADDVAAESRALAGNDQQLFDQVVASSRAHQAHARKLAQDYGYKVCGG